MGRIRTLIPDSYGVGVTKLHEAFGGTGHADPNTGTEGAALVTTPEGRARRMAGPTRSADTPFRLSVATPYNIFQANPFRQGLLIENLDPVTNLQISFGRIADANSFSLGPLGTMLLDFVCPTDAVWLFATAAVGGVAIEFSPIAQG